VFRITVPSSLAHSAWSESSAVCPRPRGGHRKGEKVGTWACDAPKARPTGQSPHVGGVFVQRRPKRRMARPEGPSRYFGCGSFVDERRSSGEARRAEPTSPFLVASDQKRQILALVVSPQGVSMGTNTSQCRRLSYFEP